MSRLGLTITTINEPRIALTVPFCNRDVLYLYQPILAFFSDPYFNHREGATEPFLIQRKFLVTVSSSDLAIFTSLVPHPSA